MSTDIPTDTRTIDAALLAQLQTWQGKTETLTDHITAAPVRALSATLDRDDAEPVPGARLPELWHWLYFLPHHRQSEIGPDGHAKRGGFLPPVPLPRRMWAGGRLQWHQPLSVGDAVKRVSRIESVTHKAGRTGDLVFVLVKHEVHNDQGLALTEEHDIVYRDFAPADAPTVKPQPAPSDETFSRAIVPDDVLLFRYSALTFNGHRIHYDRRYVTEVEGYPGLIVHGPLIATLLLDLLRRHVLDVQPQARLRRFAFKALSPLFDIHRFSVCGRPDGQSRFALWARNHEGALAMQASAEIA